MRTASKSWKEEGTTDSAEGIGMASRKGTKIAKRKEKPQMNADERRGKKPRKTRRARRGQWIAGGHM
jgi:hypothetical protein